MAGRVVAEGWRCRAGQPQAACIRKLLRRLRGGRLRPFADRTNVSATSCAPASACAAACAAAPKKRVDVVAFGGSVTVGHGTGGRSGNRESKFMPYVELFAAALRVTSGSQRPVAVTIFKRFGVPSFCFHAMAKAAGAEPSIVILEFFVNGLDRLGFLAAGVRAAYPAAVVVYLDVFSMDELSMPGCRSLDRIPSLAPNDIPGVSLRPGFLPSGDRPGSFKTAGLLYGNRKRATRIHMNVFVAFMQSFKAKAPYGVAAISADNATPPTLFDGGALQDRLHLLITRRIAVAEPGPHELELVMTNETQTAGHAFAFYGVFAQANFGRRRP
ncbi:3-oxoacyl-[acyl-carrier-protein] reductase [Aureococcus anophagefferens]|nr:3-oxoacyl-[acyl-carrier-protein] reductase [Aureococcus anophagefferens]